MFNVTEIEKKWKKKWNHPSRKITAWHKLIPTQCQVALDYKLFIACQTLLGSCGFLGCFWASKLRQKYITEMGHEQLYLWLILYSGDIAVSEKTSHKLVNINSNGDLWRAYTKSNIDLWDQNFVDGKYVIAYQFNPRLNPKVKNMLPKVNIFGSD